MKEIEVFCKNSQQRKSYLPGTTLLGVAYDMQIKLDFQILGAYVNNELKELSYEIYTPITVDFIDISNPDGMRIYQRTLTFLLQKALKDLFPKHTLIVQHSVSKGLYCEVSNGGEEFTMTQINKLEQYMRKLVAEDIPFVKKKIPTEEAIKLFAANEYHEKILLLKTRPRFYTSVYFLNDYADHYYGPLLPSTGFLKTFGLFAYYKGLLLMFPRVDEPDKLENIVVQNKMFEIFQEHKEWNRILGAHSAGRINDAVRQNKFGELIKVNEALHEKKYAAIADAISQRKDVKLILIAGPSSSGKTTTAKRIAIQLKVAGLNPVIISLDNYFVDREFTPKDAKGEYDFESIHALDLKLLNEQINNLLEGKTVLIPKFSFYTGKRYYDNENLTLSAEDVLIIEGIHALNPELTEYIDNNRKFKIYASALTSIALDNNNRIPTTDNRLIRRIVRDAQTRSYSAIDTIRRWQSVRRGENRNIFPYQENADVMFNSSLVYELSVLRIYVEPLLLKIPPTEPEYAEAVRLLKFISYFTQADIKDIKQIPPTSVLREFTGFSSFSY
ncbi:MAG: nucleoside kinase [Prevotellaceae bacterium]|jgi:uridine kinase|nr:nucleoside kinase [Prevotellaceae bacterium]